MKRMNAIVLVSLSLLLGACVSVTGVVWEDLDADGIQDPGEPPLSDVAVTFVNDFSDVAAGVTVFTDESGAYEFSFQLAPPPAQLSTGTDYALVFTPPAGYQISPQYATSYDLDSDPNPDDGWLVFTWHPQDLSPDFAHWDAGMFMLESVEEPEELFSLSDFVWVDSNGDGIQDTDEAGLPGVIIELNQLGGGLSLNTVSDANGEYRFANLPAGSYQLEFMAPEGYELTAMDQGSDDALDSDADPATSLTGNIAVSGDDSSVDAGFVEVATAGGGSLEPVDYCVGPDLADLPEGYSALTGQMVADPSLLELRPVFLSISLFPPSVRPPTGLSVSPMTYQFYIGEGDTRLLSAFYGEYPEIIFDPGEDGVEAQSPAGDTVIGDVVWFDLNGNSLQDSGEPGIPRIPVTLWVDGSPFASTTTDDFGRYYFDYSAAESPSTLQVQFQLTDEYEDLFFVSKDAGSDDAIDSDVWEGGDAVGFSEVLTIGSEVGQPDFSVDAGLRSVAYRIAGVRSGRVFYEPIRRQFCGCLITAGADPTVAAQIQTCGFAASTDTGDIGASGVDINQLGQIAAANSEDNACANPNLSGNLFCTQAPQLTGSPANELFTFWNVNNRDHFVYVPEMGAYTWAKNLPANNENFEVLTDGLNGETLYFENVVVMLTTMTQLNDDGTIFDMDLDHTTGQAYILRNGQVYEALWSTIAGDYEQSTGLQRPYRFTDLDGNPFPFAPGQTFVQMLHSFHLFEETGPGIWRARFYAPAYP